MLAARKPPESTGLKAYSLHAVPSSDAANPEQVAARRGRRGADLGGVDRGLAAEDLAVGAEDGAVLHREVAVGGGVGGGGRSEVEAVEALEADPLAGLGAPLGEEHHLASDDVRPGRAEAREDPGDALCVHHDLVGHEPAVGQIRVASARGASRRAAHEEQGEEATHSDPQRG